MGRIQQQLLKDDCYLIGIRNEDAADLVRTATAITASSALPEAGPELVRSGQSRSVHGQARPSGPATLQRTPRQNIARRNSPTASARRPAAPFQACIGG